MKAVVVPPGGGRFIAVGSAGTGVTVKASDAETGGLCTVWEGEVPPGAVGAGPHYHHGRDEFFYLVEGELVLRIGDEHHTAGPGTFAFIPLIAGKLDHGESGFRLGLALGAIDTLDPQAVGDVLADRHMRKQRIVLEHGVDVALVGRHAFGGLAENLDMALVRLLEAGDEAQAGGLARARGPEHGEELTFGDVERDAVDGADRAEPAADVHEPDGWRHGLGHRGSGPGFRGPGRSCRSGYLPRMAM